MRVFFFCCSALESSGFFFFSSRRRHTRLTCDWSSDVCSSDLYIGHSMYLDEVLPKVVAGTWSNEDVETLTKLEGEVQEVYRAIGGADAEAGLNALAGFEKKHPRIAAMPYFSGPRIGLLIKNDKLPEARKAAEEAIAKSIENDDTVTLSILAAVLRSPDAKKN